MTGLNWNVGLLALKVGGERTGPATDKIIDAIAYAHEQGARVANISIGGAYPAGQEPRAYLDAFRAAPNTLFAISAGNAGAASAKDGRQEEAHEALSRRSASQKPRARRRWVYQRTTLKPPESAGLAGRSCSR